MNSKDLARKLREEKVGFVPAPSDHLGVGGQGAINLVEALENIEVDINLPEKPTFRQVIRSIHQAIRPLKDKGRIWNPDFFWGLRELRRMARLQPDFRLE